MNSKEKDLKEMTEKFKKLSAKEQGYITAILDFIPVIQNKNSLLNQLTKEIYI